MLRAPRECDHQCMQSTPVPADLFDRWQQTLTSWTQKSSHDTLLGLAAKHGQLAWLATRYRDAARSNPHDPIARERLDRVQRAAALLAFSMPGTRAAPAKLRGSTKLLIAAMLSTGLALWLTDVMREQHQRSALVSRHP